MEPSNKQKLKALRDNLYYVGCQMIDDVLESEENKNTKKGELNTERDLYLMRWVLDECDEERLGITNPSTLDDEELQDLLDSAISAWDGGAR